MIRSIKSYLLYNANQNNEDSISSRFRKKRFGFFLQYCNEFEKPIKILDLGGSDYYWKNLNFTNNDDYRITILNKEYQETSIFKNVSFIKGDVKDLKFINDMSYDIIYSNSLIEHLNTFEEQKKLAKEIIRIGKHFFIQTPNYYFPIEPHFLFPLFQFLSNKTKIKIISKFNLGWFEKQTNELKAEELARSIRLLNKNELKHIFEDCKIHTEKFFFLNKSFIVYN